MPRIGEWSCQLPSRRAEHRHAQHLAAEQLGVGLGESHDRHRAHRVPDQNHWSEPTTSRTWYKSSASWGIRQRSASEQVDLPWERWS